MVNENPGSLGIGSVSFIVIDRLILKNGSFGIFILIDSPGSFGIGSVIFISIDKLSAKIGNFGNFIDIKNEGRKGIGIFGSLHRVML